MPRNIVKLSQLGSSMSFSNINLISYTITLQIYCWVLSFWSGSKNCWSVCLSPAPDPCSLSCLLIRLHFQPFAWVRGIWGSKWQGLVWDHRAEGLMCLGCSSWRDQSACALCVYVRLCICEQTPSWTNSGQAKYLGAGYLSGCDSGLDTQETWGSQSWLLEGQGGPSQLLGRPQCLGFGYPWDTRSGPDTRETSVCVSTWGNWEISGSIGQLLGKLSLAAAESSMSKQSC